MSTQPMPMVQVFAPDGTLGDIPYDKLHDALGAGAKIAAKVKAPDGTIGFVPGDRVPDALKAGAQRVPLDLHDADGGKPGFWSNAGSAAKNTVNSLLSGNGPALGAAAAGQGVAQAGQMAADDIDRQRMGRSVVYRVAAPLAQTLVPGLNPAAMENEAYQGHTAGVLGQAAVPAAMAVAPLAAEGIYRGASAVLPSKEAVGSVLRNAETNKPVLPLRVGGHVAKYVGGPEILNEIIPDNPVYKQNEAIAMQRSAEEDLAQQHADANRIQDVEARRVAREQAAAQRTQASQDRIAARQKAAAEAAAAKADAEARAPQSIKQSPNYNPETYKAGRASINPPPPVPPKPSPFGNATSTSTPIGNAQVPPVGSTQLPKVETVGTSPSRIVDPSSVPPAINKTLVSYPRQLLVEMAKKGDVNALAELRRNPGGIDINAAIPNAKYLSEGGAGTRIYGGPGSGTETAGSAMDSMSSTDRMAALRRMAFPDLAGGPGDFTAKAVEPQWLYRTRDVGEKGIPNESRPNMTSSLDQAMSWLESRNEGTPQEIVRVDANSLKPEKLSARPFSDSVNWYRHEGAIPEGQVEVVVPHQEEVGNE